MNGTGANLQLIWWCMELWGCKKYLREAKADKIGLVYVKGTESVQIGKWLRSIPLLFDILPVSWPLRFT